jgi:hypothetical protein
MNTDNRKRRYEKPAVRTVELQQTAQLLQGSPGGVGNRSNYIPDDNNPFGG